MPIDTSIYQNIQPLDLVGNYQRGLTMKSLMQDQKLKQDELDSNQKLKDLYANSIVKNPDGSIGIDNQKVLSGLAQINPEKYNAFQKSTTEMQQAGIKAKQEKQEFDIKNIQGLHDKISGVQDQPSWDKARSHAISIGAFNDSELPQVYDPNVVKNIYKMTGTAKEAYDQQNFDTTKSETKRHNLAMEGKVGKLNVGRQDDKDAASLDKHLKTGWAGRSGNAGIVQGKINSAEIAEQLIEQGKGQKGGLDSRQIEELAQSTARLLGGGAQASGRVEALVPHTMWGKTQSLAEWLTNNPTGTGQEEFVKRMAETVAREKSLAQDQMKKLKVSGLPVYNSFKKRNPELYKQILQANEFDDSMIDDKGRY
ncbi:MAG: hypothetical protein ABL927_13460, partial [Bdellovibrionales bacterium]